MARKKRNVSGPSAAPPVAADLSREKPSRSRRAENTSRSASRCRVPRSTAAVPARDRPVEQPPRERPGVHDPRAHVGRGLLPYPGRQQHVGRADLAQVAHRRLLALREAHPDPAQERHRHDVDLLHDPGQRQDRDILVGGLPRVGAQVGRDVLAGTAGAGAWRAWAGRWCPRWCTGSPRPRRGLARSRPRTAPGSRRQQLGPVGQEPLPADQARVVVFAHAAIVAIDDQPRRPAWSSSSSLSTCSSSSHSTTPTPAAVDQVAGLGREHVLVDPERQAAQRMRRELAPDPVRPVAADQAHHLAAPEPEAAQAQCHQPHLVAVVAPRWTRARCRDPSRASPTRSASWRRCGAGAWARCRARRATGQRNDAAVQRSGRTTARSAGPHRAARTSSAHESTIASRTIVVADAIAELPANVRAR